LVLQTRVLERSFAVYIVEPVCQLSELHCNTVAITGDVCRFLADGL